MMSTFPSCEFTPPYEHLRAESPVSLRLCQELCTYYFLSPPRSRVASQAEVTSVAAGKEHFENKHPKDPRGDPETWKQSAKK